LCHRAPVGRLTEFRHQLIPQAIPAQGSLGLVDQVGGIFETATGFPDDQAGYPFS